MDKEQKKQLSLPEQEEKILEFWEKNKIFEKSVSRRKKAKSFVSYDGPPFATGLPHYGHILASVVKDAVPRYWTMKGYRADRRWGWDCHGLPIENLVERELNISGRKSIEKLGIKKFNELARSKVLIYADEWRKTVRRIGRFVDFENSYKTMDASYMESVWWIFSELRKKGLVYKDSRISLFCPHCETALSNFEIAMDNSYRDKKDNSVYVKFPLQGRPFEYLLIWTTTPWTLPANTAVAVNPKIEYTKYKLQTQEFIWSSAPPPCESEEKPAAVEKKSGKSLLGLKYEPPFRLTQDENGYRIVPADFVNTEEGTGLVHIAPAFGEEDFNLGKKEGLPLFDTLDDTGSFNNRYSVLNFLSGKKTEEANSLIIERLKNNGYLWKVEKITHRYPVCWRCQTPLVYKIQPAWFIKISGLKPKMLALNKKIDWRPTHLKSGRFKNILETAPDWNVSRSRFWGTPLPIWQCQVGKVQNDTNNDLCGDYIVIGSLEELQKRTYKSGNKYFAMRHGEAEHNLKDISSSDLNDNHHLTGKGRKKVLNSIKKLPKIDLIFSSDFKRTAETAEIAAKYLGIKNIIYDKGLREINVGVFNGKKSEEYHSYFSSLEEKFFKAPPDGENLTELKNRVSEFLYEVDKKYRDKSILIISHEYTIWALFAGVSGLNGKEAVKLKLKAKGDFIGTGEIKKLNFIPVPHNQNFELDFHRPYIDEFPVFCGCGEEMKRIPDVFDCWFESGSMPFAEKHYPFENKKLFEKNFPADFISEYAPQTRGWFYVLHVISTALFQKPAFRHVIVTGNILSEKGEKLSKSRRNFPDPWLILNQYGADAVRYYLMSSTVMLADDINFSEKEVDEIYKKYSLIISNVLKFFELYKDKLPLAGRNPQPKIRKHILDRWILSRLHGTISEITAAFNFYEMVRATRPLLDFVQDLSLWYVRRSRERIKSDSWDGLNSLATLKIVLYNLSLLMAPVTPFLAEIIYQGIDAKKRKSVHLEDWPKADKRLIDKKLEKEISDVRAIVSQALRLRAEAGIKVRRPLASLKIKSQIFHPAPKSILVRDKNLKNKEELLNLIKGEVNVKKIIFDKNLKEEVELDTNITQELKEEGFLREIIRGVQDLRKKARLTPKDKPKLFIRANEEGAKFLKKYGVRIQKETNLLKIEITESPLPQNVFQNRLKEDNLEIDLAI